MEPQNAKWKMQRAQEGKGWRMEARGCVQCNARRNKDGDTGFWRWVRERWGDGEGVSRASGALSGLGIEVRGVEGAME